MASSNQHGRALEYLVAKTLVSVIETRKINYELTSRTISSNLRDEKHFSNLSQEMQVDFKRCANAITKWIAANNWFEGAKHVIVDRLSDMDARLSNPTDICLSITSAKKLKNFNISLKHNSNSLKHPRLTALPERCGVTDSSVVKKYQEKHDKIWDEFYRQTLTINSKSNSFKTLKEFNENFIDKYLYNPLNTLVVDFLNENASEPEHVGKFFKFLISDLDFYTFKNEHQQVLVKKFCGIQVPQKFNISFPYERRLNTFLIDYDNGWKITFRLHTASSHYFKDEKINKSVKIDVNCINIDEVIEIESIPK